MCAFTEQVEHKKESIDHNVNSNFFFQKAEKTQPVHFHNRFISAAQKR